MNNTVRTFVKNMFKFIDIGVNLTDPMFRGIYNCNSKHKEDLNDVLQRSWDMGVEKMIITGGSLEDSQTALELANTDDRLYCTVGCHPTRCQDFEASGDSNKYLLDLLDLVQKNRGKVVAIGECGLDYERIHFCPKYLQTRHFEQQIELVEKTGLPMFLHCRSAAEDFRFIVKKNRHCITGGGVVHSFDGTIEEAQEMLNLGFYIGINGWQVLEVMAGARGEDPVELARAMYKNSMDLFFPETSASQSVKG